MKRAEARTRYYTRGEAGRLGWDVQHPSRGGSFLEEQEIIDYFPDLARALGKQRPDFVSLLDGKLSTVIECKNSWTDIDKATEEAKLYADVINSVKGYKAHVAIGVAGTPDTRVQVRCLFRNGSGWKTLESHGFPLTQLPAPREVQLAIQNRDGTTDVQLPDEREFFAAATSINRILRLAKIEEAIRPKVIGAIVLALYHGNFSTDEDVAIDSINTHVKAAVARFTDLPPDRKAFLAQTLTLSTESHGLRTKVDDIVHQLERLNVRSIMRSDVDFLGQFYETFLRYGQDAKKLGIVFTPRHITRICADLADVELGHLIYDPACGTGGFLVAAFDKMMREATTPAARSQVKKSIFGCETNPTVWSLAVLNMFFRGDGKSHIVYGSCFDSPSDERFDRVLLNPPFSQDGEPETDFIDHALASAKPGGRIAAVVKTSVMVDPDLRQWRESLVTSHHVEAVITLPLELFYPTSSPTVILVVKAHAPAKGGTMVARIENDGFEISKKRRVSRSGSQLPEISKIFDRYKRGKLITAIANVASIVERNKILNGEEICAEQWLPAAPFGLEDYEQRRVEVLRHLSLAIANYPDVTDELMPNLEASLCEIETARERPAERSPLEAWFAVSNGRSAGSKNYAPGAIPYISSGDSYNGISAFIEPQEDEVFLDPCITVSAFGQACLQPWRFCARGNGGSAVRILRPLFPMTVPELIWFVGQINSQRWRFHYGRMAIVARLRYLEVDPPLADLPPMPPLRDKLLGFRDGLDALIESQGNLPDLEDARDAKIALSRLRDITERPDELVAGEALEAKLEELLR